MSREQLKDLLPYKYRKLGPGEVIRILLIKPGEKDNPIIDCDLLHEVRLKGSRFGSDTGPESIYSYEAVSYRWGDEKRTESIRIHEAHQYYRFDIDEYLYHAIVQLRERHQNRYMWIDDICINQKDRDERSRQVARMSDIYGDAQRVCIWLGAEADGSADAMRLISGHKRSLDVHNFEENCRDESFVRDWHAFTKLLRRDWFSRRWVVQEVSLAQKATIYCGACSADWEDFSAAVSFLTDFSIAESLDRAAKTFLSFVDHRDPFNDVKNLTAVTLVNTSDRIFHRSIAGQHQRVSTLEEIVARLAMFQTSEPKDYIYALLALAKDTQPYAGIPNDLDGRVLTPSEKKALAMVMRYLPRVHREKYSIDYKQDTRDVYRVFIQFVLSRAQRDCALDVICRPFASTAAGSLPSWIPDVSELPHSMVASSSRSNPGVLRARGDPFVSMPDSFTRYSAAGRKELDLDEIRFKKRSDHFSMFVQGFILDTIEPSEIDPYSQLGNIPQEWLVRGNHKDRKETFWRTLVADRGPRGPPPGVYRNVLQPYLTFRLGGRDLKNEVHNTKSDVVKDALQHVMNTIQNRCLFQSHRGYLGLGPRKLKSALAPGRICICILYGSTVPVILQEYTKAADEIEKDMEEDKKLDRLLNHRTVNLIIGRFKEERAKKRAQEQEQEAQGACSTSNLVELDEATPTDLVISPSRITLESDDMILLSGIQFASICFSLLLLVAGLMTWVGLSRHAAAVSIMFPFPHMLTALGNDRSLSMLAHQCRVNFGVCMGAGIFVVSLTVFIVLTLGSALFVSFTFVTVIDAIFTGLLPSDIAAQYRSVLAFGIEHILPQRLQNIKAILYLSAVSGRGNTNESAARKLVENLGSGSDKTLLSHDQQQLQQRTSRVDSLVGSSSSEAAIDEPHSDAGTAQSQNDTGTITEPASTDDGEASSSTAPVRNADVRKAVTGNEKKSDGDQKTQAVKQEEKRAKKEQEERDMLYSAHYYKVIGECYVDGMMTGEAIEWQNSTTTGDDRVRAQSFELR